MRATAIEFARIALFVRSFVIISLSFRKQNGAKIVALDGDDCSTTLLEKKFSAVPPNIIVGQNPTVGFVSFFWGSDFIREGDGRCCPMPGLLSCTVAMVLIVFSSFFCLLGVLFLVSLIKSNTKILLV